MGNETVEAQKGTITFSSPGEGKTEENPYPHIPPDELELLKRLNLSPEALQGLNERYENLGRIQDPGQKEFRRGELTTIKTN